MKIPCPSHLVRIAAGIYLVVLAAEPVPAQELDLTKLSLKELLDVEITLDTVFDIFGALVETKQVSVATGKKQDASRAPAVTSVITAQDIEAMGARTLSEALEGVPGFHVARQNIYQPAYIVRGISSINNPEILVLINGEPLKGLESGDRGLGWRDMPVQAIARVEVMRGPGSALYGADAFSGVVNIVTKTADDIKGSTAGVRTGSYNTYDAWALHGGKYQGWQLATMLEYQDTNGLDALIQQDVQSLMDQQMGTRASLAPGKLNLAGRTLNAHADMAKKAWRLRLGYQGQYDSGTGLGVNNALDPWGRFERDRFSADLVYHNPMFTPHWDLTVQLNYVDDRAQGKELRILPSGTMGIFPDGIIAHMETGEEHLHFGVSGFYYGFDDHLLRIGAGYRYEDLYEVISRSNLGLGLDGKPMPPGSPVVDKSDTPFAVYPEALRKNWYVFIQDSWNLRPDWDLTLGLRYDNYSDFGSTLNPRAALIWQVTPNFTSKLLYGEAFRAPSFRELYLSSNPLLLGNPALQPETIRTWELAFDWRANDTLNLALTPYSYRIQDKILAESISGQGDLRVMKSAGEQTGYGVEFEARWKMTKKSSLLFNYSHAHSELNGGKAEGYPEQGAYLRMDWLVYPSWYLDTQLNWIGKRERTKFDPRPALDGYTSVDLTLRYKNIRQGNWNFALGVRNLFDTDMRDPGTLSDDVPLPGRNGFAEARYRFD